VFQALYLSPHFDDGVLSCGAQIWDRVQGGQSVAVITITAAPPPPVGQLSPFAQELHARWSQLGDFDRAAEDTAALALLNATPIHLRFHDCIYRRSPVGEFLYASESAIFGPVSRQEDSLIEELVHSFDAIDLAPEAEVFIPYAIGHHVDHQLVRLAGERWAQKNARPFRYYADYPYAETIPGGQPVPVSPAAQEAKITALLAYRSQLSTFWASEAELKAKVGAWLERLF
jgi:LmbE family N-acetylglucosaminyl deacetylase